MFPLVEAQGRFHQAEVGHVEVIPDNGEDVGKDTEVFGGGDSLSNL